MRDHRKSWLIACGCRLHQPARVTRTKKVCSEQMNPSDTQTRSRRRRDEENCDQNREQTGGILVPGEIRRHEEAAPMQTNGCRATRRRERVGRISSRAKVKSEMCRLPGRSSHSIGRTFAKKHCQATSSSSLPLNVFAFLILHYLLLISTRPSQLVSCHHQVDGSLPRTSEQTHWPRDSSSSSGPIGDSPVFWLAEQQADDKVVAIPLATTRRAGDTARRRQVKDQLVTTTTTTTATSRANVRSQLEESRQVKQQEQRTTSRPTELAQDEVERRQLSNNFSSLNNSANNNNNDRNATQCDNQPMGHACNRRPRPTDKSELARRRRRRKRHAPGQQQKAAAGDQQTKPVISAILRGQVVLSCNLQPPDPDDEVSLVLWYKDNSMVPIYSVDARAAPVQLARHKPGAWLEGRSRLKITSAGRSLSRRHVSSSGATSKLEDNDDEDDDDRIYQLEERVRLHRRQQQLSFPFAWRFDSDAALLQHSPSPRHLVRRHKIPAALSQRANLEATGDDSLETSSSSVAAPEISLSTGGGGGGKNTESAATSQQRNEAERRKLRQRRHFLARQDVGAAPAAAGGAKQTRPRRQGNLKASETAARLLSLEDADDSQSDTGDELGQGESLPQPEARVRAATDEAEQVDGPGKMVAQLTIDALSSEDNGVYKCRVDFKRARSRIEETELRIIVPADKPTIRDLTNAPDDHPAATPTGDAPPAVSAPFTVGPHSEGARLLLECETSGGYPEPSLTWWRDGQLIDGSFEIISAADGLVLERRQVSEQNLFASSSSANTDGAEHNNEHQLEQENTTDGLGDQPAGADEVEATRRRHHNHRQQLNSNQDDPTAATDGAHSTTKNTRQVQNRLLRNRLELAALGRADLLANYSCLAWNSKLGEPPSSFVMIDMNLRPLKVQIDNERQPVLADKQLEIVCRAFGSRPAPLMSWFRGSTKLKPTGSLGAHEEHNSRELDDDQQQPQQRNKRTRNNFVSIQEAVSADANGTTTSILTIVPNLDDAGQPITCRAENTFFGQQQQQPAASNSIEDSWKLEVHHLPLVKLALGEKLLGRQVHEGQDVYFECSVLAQPAAHELRWWFNGKELETNVSLGVIISNQSLVLQRVSRKQRGRYTCSAINSVGESQSNVLQLRIQHAPYCRDSTSTITTNGDEQSQSQSSSSNNNNNLRTTTKSHYGAARMEPIKVYCHVDADPADSSLSYKWAFVAGSQAPQATASNGSTAANQQHVGQFWSGQQLVYLPAESQDPIDRANPLTGSVSYTPKSELDYGTLLCWAQNSLGSQQEPCVYQIVPAERPESVRNCRLLNATGAQLAVACEPGYDGGIEQTFHMEVYESRKPGALLVANVTNSAGLTSQLLLNGELNNTIASGDLLAGDQPSTGDDQDDEQDDSMQPESLSLSNGVDLNAVGSQVAAAKQQKQRHSMNNNNNNRNNHPRLLAAKRNNQQQQQPQGSSQEAVFLTEPQLSPATDYLLSIYASNSKGSSKPIAFTAATTNQSVGHLLPFAGRDGRRATSPGDSSAIIGEVFSLTWSPFLIVCAVTILMCVLFALVSVAVVKYVDLTGALSAGRLGNSNNNNGGGGGVRSKLSHINPIEEVKAANHNQYATTTSTTYVAASSLAGSSATSSAASQHSCEQNCRLGNLSGSNNVVCDEQTTTTTTIDEYSALSANHHCGGEAPYGRQRARVIAIGSNSDMSREQQQQFEEIPLNGIILQRRRDNRASLVNGSHLKYRLQQFANTGSQQSEAAGLAANQSLGKMKQSNSDNYLNQMTSTEQFDILNNNNSAALPVTTFDTTNWLFNTRAPLVYSQDSNLTTAAAYCMGTLPRIHHQQQPNQNQVLFASAATGPGEASLHYYQAHQPPIQSINGSSAESPYGKLTTTNNNNSPPPPPLLANGHFVSSSSSSSSPPGAQLQQQQQQSLTSMMLAPPVLSGNSGLVVGQVAANFQLQQHQQRGPIEHLVISGKQYIHQTRPASSNSAATFSTANKMQPPAANKDFPSTQRQKQKQPRHLQMTSNQKQPRQQQPHLCQQQVANQRPPVCSESFLSGGNKSGFQVGQETGPQAAQMAHEFQFEQPAEFANGNYLALATTTEQLQTNDSQQHDDGGGNNNAARCLNYITGPTTNDNNGGGGGERRHQQQQQLQQQTISKTGNAINNRLQNHDFNSTPRTSDFANAADQLPPTDNQLNNQDNLSAGTMNLQQQFDGLTGLAQDHRLGSTGCSADSMSNQTTVCNFIDSSDAMSNQSAGTQASLATSCPSNTTTNGSPSSGIGPTEFVPHHQHHQSEHRPASNGHYQFAPAENQGGGGGNLVSVLSSSPNDQQHHTGKLHSQRIQQATKKSLTFDLNLPFPLNDHDDPKVMLFNRQGNNDKNNNNLLAAAQTTAAGEHQSNLFNCNSNSNKAKKNLNTLC